MPWPLLLVVGLIPLQEDLSVLRERLRDEDERVRAEAVKALGRMDSLEATRLLPDLLVDPNAYVRDWTFTTLVRIKDEGAIAFLIQEGMRRPEEKIRMDLAEWAGEARVHEAVPGLVGLLEDRSPRVRAAAADSLAEIGDPAAASGLRERLGERRPLLRARFLVALGRLAGKEAAKEVREGASDRAWQIRVASVLLAGRCLPGEEALEIGLLGMRDRAWPVRAAAVALLADLRDPGGVGPLIDALQWEGRLRHDAYGALRRITGKEIPLEPDLWTRWWEVNRKRFEPPAKGPAPDPTRKTRTRLLYHGLPVVSRRIAFVLDLSGSMRDPLDGGGGPSRLDLAREELSRVIREIPRKAVFNLYFYNEVVTSWQGQAVPATRRRRAEALAFLARQEAGGYTNLYGALEKALDDLAIDTIYLLSDGGPSRGEVIFRDRILRRITERNRIRRVTIHTIDTGSRLRHQTALLKDLAAATGGSTLRLVEE